ncbi:MAG: TonB-dependent receptor [Acidobacteriota bacterium]
MRVVVRVVAILCLSLLIPNAVRAQASAQASVTGVVRDASGAVLPGVTVEASSPALIEKVRTAVSDAAGQYRVVNLPGGQYTVSFSLTGFSTVRREGIELAGSFAAVVNAEMKVGSVSETITVVGEAPIVDTQNAKQERTIDSVLLKSIPMGRTQNSLVTLVPGLNYNSNNVGGVNGPVSVTFSSHGGQTNEGRLQLDGMPAGAAIGGAGVSGYLVDVANSQEVNISLSGSLGESEIGGAVINVVPRTGGNRHSGSWFTSFADAKLVGQNLDRYPTVTRPDSLIRDYDLNGALGGPIQKDRLWFFALGRIQGNWKGVTNMYRNLNAGVFAAPYAADLNNPDQTKGQWKNANGRVTWQASARNKINFYWDQHQWCNPCGGGSATTSAEANTTAAVGPNAHVMQASWTNPLTSKILLDAGVNVLQQFWGIYPSYDVPFNMNIPRVTETNAPNVRNASVTTGAPSLWDAYSRNASFRAAITFVTGGHNIKVGYQSSFLAEADTFSENATNLWYTVNAGNPTGITMWARPRTYLERANFNAFYAQDQFTMNRLTVSGALRYDHSWSWFPSQTTGPTSFVPQQFGFDRTDGVSLNDISPRWGVSYDVFGNGRTAVKYNQGRYLSPTQVGGRYNAVNPMRRMTESVARTWADSNGNRIVDCDLVNLAAQNLSTTGGDVCGGVTGNFGRDPRTFGFATTYDPSLLSGWTKRLTDWQYGVGVQHQLLPRVSAEVTFNKRWYNNFELTDDLNRNPADYQPYTVAVPVDSRLPSDVSGSIQTGYYDITPAANVRATNNIVTLTSDRYEYWKGVDVNFTVRASGSLRLQGGTSTGRSVTDNCAVLVNNPNPRGCHREDPFQTNVRGVASYVIPKIDVNVSGLYQYKPGTTLAANYTLSAADIAAVTAQLGRAPTTGAGTTVNLLIPGAVFGDAVNELDIKIAKVIKFGRARANAGIDIYNLTNDDAITGYNSTFSPTNTTFWTPSAVLHPRFARFSVQIDW